MIADVFDLFSLEISGLSVIVATVGSLSLLIFRLTRKPEPQVRLAASLMLMGIGLSFLPGLTLWMIPTLLDQPLADGVTTLFYAVTLPALPLFYSYATYKRGLGALEFRANQFLSAYSFGLIYLTGFVLIFILATFITGASSNNLLLDVILSGLFILAAPLAYNRFRRWVHRIAYGSQHNADDVLRLVAQRIPAAPDRGALVHLLADEVAPSLMIHQSALFLWPTATAQPECIYRRDVSAAEMAHVESPYVLLKLLHDADRYRRPLSDTQAAPVTETDWVRLAIPIRIQGMPLGVWLLGRRDPDDFYPQMDINLLESIAGQMAPALENMRLYESLRQQADELAALYKATSELLTPGSGVKRLAQEIVQTITREFNVADCGVMLVNELERELTRVARAGSYPVMVSAPLKLDGPGLVVHSIREGIVVYVPDVTAHPQYLATISTTRSEMVIPLKVGGRILGVLDLQSPEVDGFSERTRRILSTFSERAALALENALLLENITQAREVAEEANQLKSEFLANTSHELRTPLAGILGSLSLVLDGMCDSPEEQKEFLTAAHTSARNLLQIVNDILDLAKIEAGQMTVAPHPIDIGLAFAEVQSLTQSLARAKSLEVTFQVTPAGAPLVMADPDRLRQILINLVGNGIKFTEVGFVRVEAQVNGAGQMQVRVQDTGIGIPLEKQAKLFRAFVQVDGSSTRRYGGTGLGLSISRRLAELMGGTLSLESAGAEMGSTFILTLPLADASALPGPSIAQLPDLSPAHPSPTHV
jgi:signal transduction histidine kinase